MVRQVYKHPILSRTPDRVQALRQITQHIEALPDQNERGNVAAATYILAGLVLEKAVIREILREEIMKESVTYQDILKQGLQQGRQEGESTLLLRLLQRRFGNVDEAMRDRICALSIEQLELLGEALLDFTQLTDLERWLAHNA